MNIEVDKIAVDIDVIVPDAVVVEAVAELPTQVVVISDQEIPTVTPLQIVDYGSSSIECSFDVSTEQAEEVVRGVLCGTTNPPTFENADYRLLHGQGSMDLVFAGLQNNTEYYLRPYALSNLGYKYGDVVSQKTKYNPIPDEYQFVEYLETSGSQFFKIDNVAVDEHIGYKVRFASLNNSGQHAIFGNITVVNFLAEIVNGDIRYAYRTTGTGSRSTGISANIGEFCTIDFNSNDDHIVLVNNAFQFPYESSLSANVTLYFFSYYIGYYFIGRISSFEFYNRANIERNLVSVYRKADNKPGMYDIVNNQFYTNQGTGEFTVGPDRDWQED